jgi:hypothetical protein
MLLPNWFVNQHPGTAAEQKQRKTGVSIILAASLGAFVGSLLFASAGLWHALFAAYIANVVFHAVWDILAKTTGLFPELVLGQQEVVSYIEARWKNMLGEANWMKLQQKTYLCILLQLHFL